MTSQRRYSVGALVLAGTLWGASVPLSKLSLQWLSPTSLTVGRFLVTGLILAVIGRRGLRDALSWKVALAGVFGFGLCIVLQNVGLQHTSVSHTAVLCGIVPVFVALLSVLLGHGHASLREWGAYAVAVTGIALIAGGGGGGASIGGDVVVLASVLLSAGFIAVQPALLEGRDPAAVTAVQFIVASVSMAPLLLIGGGRSLAVHSAGPVVAFAALSVFGTLLPFWLFAYGQSRVPARVAGAFVNLEPVVGAVIGWVAFSNPFSIFGLAGALLVLAGVALAATETPLADLALRLSVGTFGWFDEARMVVRRRWAPVGRALGSMSSGFEALGTLPEVWEPLPEE